MKQQVVLIDKPLGKTPLQMVEFFKEKNPEYVKSTISYAGRLDPMAHGMLLLLVDEENKKREEYLHLDKTYEVEILFGFETDTYDVLGKVVKISNLPKVSKAKIEQEIGKFIGKREQEYPPYSSKTVEGKPLFWWARKNKLAEIKIPTIAIEISDITYLAERALSGEALLETIEPNIGKVHGDFRQDEILSEWRRNIDTKNMYQLIKIQVSCSSGTYMRSLAHELGKRIGCGAIAYDIYRTRVGKYAIENVLRNTT